MPLISAHDPSLRSRDVPAKAAALLSPSVADTTRPQPAWLSRPPDPLGGHGVQFPESRSERLKRILLGPALISESLQGERLGKPTALAVLSSDVMSSCAYATESILTILIPVVGLGAFGLITPMTILILAVLGVICLCYRQVVQAYPVSGGSYVVSRENFGYSTAQIPGAALLCSYTLTVAVSIAAGADAIASAFPVLNHGQLAISIGFVILITFGNLRGIREAGRIFAVPTYWFLFSMAVLIAIGIVRALTGSLHKFPLQTHGHIALGHPGPGLLLGASLFIFLRAFANGGSAMTGMEAISNSVSVFREPQVPNARMTLVTMAGILGAMFLGVSVLAALTHAIPFSSGTPTVLSQIGRQVFGQALDGLPYYSLQFSTALILFLGANTSYNGFPLLVSFIAEDAYLPRPLTTRGHRLVYSNGIFALTIASLVLLVATRARVQSLIPLYATTVFTGFTMAGAGMLRYHLHHQGPRRTRGIIVNAAAFGASAVVTLIFVITEFARGAWAVVVAIPIIVFLLTRTHLRYEEEKVALSEDVVSPRTEPAALRNHVVIVLVDRVDLATSRAMQLARSIGASSQLRAVHFAVDPQRAQRLATMWGSLGIGQLVLEVFECPDRKLVRSVAELAVELAGDGETEVTLILPRRVYHGLASRLLHDFTADRIVSAVGPIPHVSATVAPFDVEGLLSRRQARRSRRVAQAARAKVDGGPEAVLGTAAPLRVVAAVPGKDLQPDGPQGRGASRADEPPLSLPANLTPIAGATYRARCRIGGRVRSIRVQPWSGVPALECILVDSSGAISVVFLGRRRIAGVGVGTILVVNGVIGRHRDQLAVINPEYEIVLSAEGRQTIGEADAGHAGTGRREQ